MKAVAEQGPRQITVEERPDTRIQSPTDAIIQLTATDIGGKILGHENTGVVAEVGAAVERIRVGDRVSVPFNIACGTCRTPTSTCSSCRRAGSGPACSRA